jgi:hypothetical protein
MKHIRQLIVALVVVMATALLVAPTFAQDNPATPTAPSTNSGAPHRPSAQGNGLGTRITTLTISITQEDINARLANRPGKLLKDLSIVLGDNQITVSFTTNGEKNKGVGRKIVGVVTPGVADGKVKWTLDSLTIDGTAATQDQMDKLKARVTDLIGGKFGERERRFSVSVDSSAITIMLTRNKNA